MLTLSANQFADTAERPILRRCPACGHRGLWATGLSPNFVCPGCGCCWHSGDGFAQRVDASVCPGCPSRAICTATAPAEAAWR